MSAEFVASLRPVDFQRESDLGNDLGVQLVLTPGEATPGASTPGSSYRALSLPKYKLSGQGKYGYIGMFRIPANLTLSTGLTFDVYLTDDGSSAVDLGTVVKLGLTIKRLPANATIDVDTSPAAEVVASCTLSTTSAGVSITSIAIAVAALPASIAAGDLLIMRLRRVGTNAGDTCLGRALLLHVDVQNT